MPCWGEWPDVGQDCHPDNWLFVFLGEFLSQEICYVFVHLRSGGYIQFGLRMLLKKSFFSLERQCLRCLVRYLMMGFGTISSNGYSSSSVPWLDNGSWVEVGDAWFLFCWGSHQNHPPPGPDLHCEGQVPWAWQVEHPTTQWVSIYPMMHTTSSACKHWLVTNVPLGGGSPDEVINPPATCFWLLLGPHAHLVRLSACLGLSCETVNPQALYLHLLFRAWRGKRAISAPCPRLSAVLAGFIQPLKDPPTCVLCSRNLSKMSFMTILHWSS